QLSAPDDADDEGTGGGYGFRHAGQPTGRDGTPTQGSPGSVTPGAGPSVRPLGVPEPVRVRPARSGHRIRKMIIRWTMKLTVVAAPWPITNAITCAASCGRSGGPYRRTAQNTSRVSPVFRKNVIR